LTDLLAIFVMLTVDVVWIYETRSRGSGCRYFEAKGKDISCFVWEMRREWCHCVGYF